MSSNAKRLARYVLARRTELDMTQLDVWQSGGPSNTTLTQIEKGAIATLTRTTARKLDAGLRWEPGSAREVWAGGEPTPLGDGRSVAQILEELDQANVSESTKAYIRERLSSQLGQEDKGVRGA